ncbi:type VI secretion system-associated protein VasI [Serratia microhaemolytica]|uniref:type VI secretion system-associated protein VasI n=1 Tax=Serratia microhaemolytica TaxID=2675110 RepID=UPI000FDEB3BD|nr:type VI secretion system-associated protein VasI [Serratia microhaemolytica]
MSVWLLLTSLLLQSAYDVASLMTPSTVAPTAAASAEHEGLQKKLAVVMRCRSETSPLVRLDCYDQALSLKPEARLAPVLAGVAWQRAMAQEKTRVDHSTAFLTTESEGPHPQVVITTPALGVAPPRPVLMFSCIDNITRLQVALVEPQKESSVWLITDNDRFDGQWFLRENGYVLEASRGLDAIDNIKQLMNANTLTIEGKNGGFSRLTFTLAQLPQALKPLRSACHW